MEVGNKRVDNRGMTLVELLIAIVILAIITVPLLHAFVSAARVNMDSRKRLRLTTVAQDVMEGLRADTLVELAGEFNYPDAVVSGNRFHVIDRKLVLGSISENRCSIDADGGVTGFMNVDPTALVTDQLPSVEPVVGSVSYNFVPRDGSIAGRDDGKYYFSMENVTIEDPGVANYKVDVLISASAAPYRMGGTVSGDNARHNTTAFVDINDMNERCDYLFYLKLQRYLDEKFPGLGLTTKDVYCKIDMELDTTYACKLNLSIYRASNDALLSSEPVTQITKTEARNVYLLYDPTYTHTAKPDVISFTNNTSDDINFCIVKQYDSSDSDIRSNLNTYEKDYRCVVNINDTGLHTKVRTNLDYNLYEIEVSGNRLVRMDAGDHWPMPHDRQATFKYNSSAMSAADEAQYIGPLGGSNVTDRLYDVRVYIYDEGSIAAARSSGTIASDKLLVTLDGTIK